jgi:hypothetical protein
MVSSSLLSRAMTPSLLVPCSMGLEPDWWVPMGLVVGGQAYLMSKAGWLEIHECHRARERLLAEEGRS